MLPKCQLVEMLQAVQEGAHARHFTGLEYVVEAALNIIRDAHFEVVSDFDARTLADLIHEIRLAGCCDANLMDYLLADSQDCDICRAVAAKMNLAT